MNDLKVDKVLIGEETVNKITINGKNPGPWLHMQASIHGAEVMGNKVIHLLLEFFKTNPINGKITLIPHANPYSAKNKSGTYSTGRFCPITGENWNRVYTDVTRVDLFKDNFLKNMSLYKNDSEAFKSLIKQSLISLKKNPYSMSRGTKLGLELQIQASEADIFLDLHTGPVATEYLYVSERQKQLSKDFKFSNQIIIPNTFDTAGDEAFFIPWSKLEEGTSSPFLGGEAYTVELGSEETINKQDAILFRDKILDFLFKRKIINSEIKLENTEILQRPLENFQTYYCECDGLVEFLKAPGQRVKQGETLYTIMNLKNMSSESYTEDIKKIKAIKDGTIINHSPSANMLSGMEIYQVLED